MQLGNEILSTFFKETRSRFSSFITSQYSSLKHLVVPLSNLQAPALQSLFANLLLYFFQSNGIYLGIKPPKPHHPPQKKTRTPVFSLPPNLPSSNLLIIFLQSHTKYRPSKIIHLNLLPRTPPPPALLPFLLHLPPHNLLIRERKPTDAHPPLLPPKNQAPRPPSGQPAGSRDPERERRRPIVPRVARPGVEGGARVVDRGQDEGGRGERVVGCGCYPGGKWSFSSAVVWSFEGGGGRVYIRPQRTLAEQSP